MFPGRALGTTMLAAGAIAVAACGSDKSVGPTTANNAQIIAEMKAALDSPAGPTFVSGMGLQAAITALGSGAPVNPTDVTIDGQSYRFNTTVLTQEVRDSTSGDLITRASILVGWRGTSGDSMLIALYAPELEVVADRRAPVSLMRLGGSDGISPTALGAMLRGAKYTVSRDISSGRDTPIIFALGLGENVWVATADGGIASGSASYAAASGECDASSLGEYGLSDHYDGCESMRANVSLSAQTRDMMPSEEDPTGPEVTIANQGVLGVQLTLLAAAY